MKNALRRKLTAIADAFEQLIKTPIISLMRLLRCLGRSNQVVSPTPRALVRKIYRTAAREALPYGPDEPRVCPAYFDVTVPQGSWEEFYRHDTEQIGADIAERVYQRICESEAICIERMPEVRIECSMQPDCEGTRVTAHFHNERRRVQPDAAERAAKREQGSRAGATAGRAAERAAAPAAARAAAPAAGRASAQVLSDREAAAGDMAQASANASAPVAAGFRASGRPSAIADEPALERTVLRDPLGRAAGEKADADWPEFQADGRPRAKAQAEPQGEPRAGSQAEPHDAPFAGAQPNPQAESQVKQQVELQVEQKPKTRAGAQGESRAGAQGEPRAGAQVIPTATPEPPAASAPPAAPEPQPAPMPRPAPEPLAVLRGKTDRYLVRDGDILGVVRGQSPVRPTVCLPLETFPFASREHARFVYDATSGTWTLEQLGRHGTRVARGSRLIDVAPGESLPLQSDDRLVIPRSNEVLEFNAGPLEATTLL